MWLLWAVKDDHGVHVRSLLRPDETNPSTISWRQILAHECIAEGGLDLVTELPWYNEPTNRPPTNELPDAMQ